MAANWRGRVDHASPRQKALLFEKRSKNFCPFRYGPVVRRAPEEAKVFWFFFSKKNS
jgi:hypothetical protein